MDAVVLCGGMGTRLRSVTAKPKILAEISGRPFIDYLLDDFKAQHIKRVILCTGYGAQEVEEYCQKNVRGIECLFSVEHKPLGTGGAIKKAMTHVTSDPFIALNGDAFFNIDLAALVKFHQEHKSIATLVTSRVDDARDFGTLEIDKDLRIRKFLEKVPEAKPGDVSVGMYCFSKQLLSKMPTSEAFSIEREVFPILVNDPFYAFKIKEDFLDIGTPQRYEEANKKFKK